MVKIESDAKTINKADTVLFNFLSDFRNFDKLMPEKVINWQSTIDKCSFTISGLTSLGMEIIERTPFSVIKIRESGKAAFEFDFIINLDKLDDNQTKVKLSFNAELNPMLSMMITKPLKNFLDILVTKLSEIPD
jgi:hypothetical protein